MATLRYLIRYLIFTVLLAGLLGGCGKLDTPTPGTYRAEIKLRGGAVPFELQVKEQQGRATLAMAAGEEWLPLTGVTLQDGTLQAQLPEAAGSLRATIGRGDLKGEVQLTDPQGKPHTLPFSAELDKHYRFVEKPSTDNADISGYWLLEIMDHQHFTMPVTLQLMQRFDAVDGHLLLPANGQPNDQQVTKQIAMLGQVHGDEVYLAALGQGRAMLLKGRVNKQGELQGEAWVNLNAASNWVARRMQDDEVAALTTADEPVRKVALPWSIPTQ